ncbi:MAG TPA: Zn-dependent hydrolase [Bacteroidales bacterium]|nr:Zn-dependent hydrolase [Bacteroidales bacterium]HPT10417.1 Zn-dependent hydrolase [Bacteroidales bacterium]
MNRTIFSALTCLLLLFSAGNSFADGKKVSKLSPQDSLMKAKIGEFVMVRLTTDVAQLSENDRRMIPLLIEVAKIMDDLYWKQVITERKKFLDSIRDPFIRRFADINYGPWERLNNNEPFVKGFGPKPAGVNFYPKDMTKAEFDKWMNKDKTSPYTVIKRKTDKTLSAVWYHDLYKTELTRAATMLNQAANYALDSGLRKYLNLRATALLTDKYYDSDMAWMDMKNNTLDFVVGPIENYEDALFGCKTAYEAALLVKDKEWSKKLAKYAQFLPELQQQLPVSDPYKSEKPGTDSDLNAYDIIYVSGHSNAGSKTIAINLPNDEKVQMAKGSRRLQLKNAMRAKFDNILVPISKILIDSSQKQYIKFDAFFSNVMFHEVAHGLGIKNTINGKGTVRDALKEKYAAFEEAKADILGLYMVVKLIEKGEIKEATREDCYVTFMAGLIRSVRFGAASAHGKANMMCFNYFAEKGAFERSATGVYKVNFDKIGKAMNDWCAQVLTYEGNGDYQGASAYLETNGVIHTALQKDLDHLKNAKIPVDIVYSQGMSFLGLRK